MQEIKDEIGKAENALARGEIEYFFHIPANYERDDRIEHVTQKVDFALQDTSAIELLLRENLLAELDPTLRQRIEQPGRQASRKDQGIGRDVGTLECQSRRQALVSSSRRDGQELRRADTSLARFVFDALRARSAGIPDAD